MCRCYHGTVFTLQKEKVLAVLFVVACCVYVNDFLVSVSIYLMYLDLSLLTFIHTVHFPAEKTKNNLL